MTDFCCRRSVVFILTFLLSLSVIGAFAQHAAKGNGQEEATVGSAGQQVAKDPATGKFRAPTPEELQVLTADLAKNDSTEGLVEKTTDSGAIVVNLEGRFENYSLAKMGPDGKIVLGCATTAKQAREFYIATPKKQTPKPAAKPASDPNTWEVK